MARDFWGGDIDFEENNNNNDNPVKISNPKEIKNKKPILVVQDIFNNLFAIKEVPDWAKGNDDNLNRKYFHPRDRNGKLLKNRYTSVDVDNALSNYVEACENASNKVKEVLVKLSETLCDTGHLPALVQAAHTNLILSTATHHAASSGL